MSARDRKDTPDKGAHELYRPSAFNDERYGGSEIRKGTIYAKYKQFIRNCFELCPRQALHAKTLGFNHPRTGEFIRFDSDLPQDMQALIKKWRDYAGNMKEEED